MISDGFFEQLVELPRSRIAFDLTVPHLGFPLEDPLAQFRQLSRRYGTIVTTPETSFVGQALLAWRVIVDCPGPCVLV